MIPGPCVPDGGSSLSDVNAGRLKSPAAIRQLFEQAGVTGGRTPDVLRGGVCAPASPILAPGSRGFQRSSTRIVERLDDA